jgi:hypothetical protein
MFQILIARPSRRVIVLWRHNKGICILFMHSTVRNALYQTCLVRIYQPECLRESYQPRKYHSTAHDRFSRSMGQRYSKALPDLPVSSASTTRSPLTSSANSSTTAYSFKLAASILPEATNHRSTSSCSTTSTTAPSFHPTTSYTSILKRRKLSPTSNLPHLDTDIVHSTRPQHELHHLSYLIDPDQLDQGAFVRSPSGNLLGKEGYFTRDDRPLSLRERQERIRAGLATPTLQNPATASPTSDVDSLRRVGSVASSLAKSVGKVAEKRQVLCEKAANARMVELQVEQVQEKQNKKKRKASLLCY